VDGALKSAPFVMREVHLITRDMIISDIITQHPETLTVFKEYHLECHECQIADLETIEHGAGVHKVSIDDLLVSLNGVCVVHH
jgi:hybrid cluster-associated redox disulfide protein